MISGSAVRTYVLRYMLCILQSHDNSESMTGDDHTEIFQKNLLNPNLITLVVVTKLDM